MAALTLDQLETEISAGRLLDQSSQLTLVRRLRAALKERDGARTQAEVVTRAAAALRDSDPLDFLRAKCGV